MAARSSTNPNKDLKIKSPSATPNYHDHKVKASHLQRLVDASDDKELNMLSEENKELNAAKVKAAKSSRGDSSKLLKNWRLDSRQLTLTLVMYDLTMP